MPHLLEQMAYVGDTPWHGLGQALPPHQPLSVWSKAAGMDWSIRESPVQYLDDANGRLASIHAYPEQKVLYRSDTKAPLAVVSQRYQVVQPQDILQFYRDLTECSGFTLETAGVLKGGKKFWALARTGQETILKGHDTVQGYLLLATSCDGTLATTATPTAIRVVCHNTLSLAVETATQAIRVPHSTRFDPEAVKAQLGLAVTAWDRFLGSMKALANRKVSPQEAEQYFERLLVTAPSVPLTSLGGDGPSNSAVTSDRSRLAVSQTENRPLREVQAKFAGAGRGATLASAKGTAWGLLNAVTEYVDYDKRARNGEYRWDSALFGAGAQLKQKALDQALALVA